MSFRAANIDIIKVDRIEIAAKSSPWEFAATHHEEITRYFARLQEAKPALWNGRVVMLNHYAIGERTLRGTCFETDYASFIAWRDWDFPDRDVYNIFAAAALRAADGAYILGRMAPYTAGAHQLCLPCGTPEPADIAADGKLDLEANLHRELEEETGVAISELVVEPGWTLIFDRCLVAAVKQVYSHENAAALRSRIMRHLAAEAQPELCDVCIVQGPADLDAWAPGFIVAALQEFWRQ